MLDLVNEGWYRKYKKENYVVCKTERYKLCNYLYELKKLKVQGPLNQTIPACNL